MNVNLLTQLLPVLIPLAAIQVGLMLGALIHLLRHQRVKRGNVAIWAVVIILINIIGPILYFTIGREDA